MRASLHLFDGSRRLVGWSLAISIVQSLLLVPIAFLVRRAFDVTIPDGDSAGLIWIGAAVLVLYLASSGLGLLTRWLSLRAVKTSVAQMRMELVRKILALPRAYFDRTDLGTLHSTIVQDTERLDMMANALVAVLMPATVISVALIATLVVLNPLLAGLLLLATPALVLAGRPLGRTVRRRTRGWQTAFDAFSSQTQQALRGATLAKLHGAEQMELERRRSRVEELGETGRAVAWMQSAYNLLQQALSATAGVIVLVVGGAAVADGRMSLGDLISFYAVLGLLRTQLTTGAIALPQVISGTESLARLQLILDEEATEPYSGRRPIEFQGAVAFRDVSFEYRAGEPVLRDVSLDVAPGETAVLLGPNGAGKSTILSLIAGLYAPSSGTIAVDGLPLDEVDLTQLRRALGMVMQDPLIFPASVRENIAYGRPEASPAELERAARRAGAHDFIRELPGAYEARVGDDGVLLSGGQRRRLSIARALLGEPAMLMLDEPTTHLDRASADELIRDLTSARDLPTVLIVSHDPAVAALADRLYLLRDGTLVEQTESSSDIAVELGTTGQGPPG